MTLPLDKGQPPHRSHLFTLRLWPEELGDGRLEWRGKVEHVLSGQARYFRAWPALVESLAAMLVELKDDEPPG